jgi:hypothetical protein
MPGGCRRTPDLRREELVIAADTGTTLVKWTEPGIIFPER